MLVLTGYELNCLLRDRGTAVSSRTAVCDSRNERAADTLDVDSVMFIETLVLDCDDRFV